jgi:hypothetical protein
MRNGNGGNDPVCPNGQRNRDDGAYVRHRKPRSFNFLYNRCTATSTGSSGGCNDDGIHIVVLELLGDFTSVTRCVGN